MTLEFTEEYLSIHQKLNKEEARVFMLFLISDKIRHEGDIKKISRTLLCLSKKWGIEIPKDPWLK